MFEFWCLTPNIRVNSMLSPMLTLEGPEIAWNAFKQGLSDNFMLSLRQKCIVIILKFRKLNFRSKGHGAPRVFPNVGLFESHGGNVLVPRWEQFSPTVGTKLISVSLWVVSSHSRSCRSHESANHRERDGSQAWWPRSGGCRWSGRAPANGWSRHRGCR